MKCILCYYLLVYWRREAIYSALSEIDHDVDEALFICSVARCCALLVGGGAAAVALRCIASRGPGLDGWPSSVCKHDALQQCLRHDGEHRGSRELAA